MPLQERIECSVLEEDGRLEDVHVGADVGSDGLHHGLEEGSDLRCSLWHNIKVAVVVRNTRRERALEEELTAMRSPSTSSLKSLAALTRERDLIVSSLCSKSSIMANHGSPTGVSRMAVASEGGILRSEIS